jgi:transposase
MVRRALLRKIGDRGHSAADNRKSLNAVLWIAKTVAPWRELPQRFGNWDSNFRRSHRWATKGFFDLLIERIYRDRRYYCSGPPAGHRRKGGHIVGRSRGGLTPKIVAVVDALGKLTRSFYCPVKVTISSG